MKKYRLLKKSFLARILGLLMVFLFLSAFTAPEKPDYGIYDPNHYLTEDTITQIRDLNEANSKKAEKLQVGVYIVDSLEGESIETVANETARTWKIGYSGDNFGSLIVVAVQDRKSRIETSNNTAIRITDYQTKQILAASRTDFKNGDYSKGILAIAKALDNQFYKGSGTFSSDETSFADASAKIRRYSIRMKLAQVSILHIYPSGEEVLHSICKIPAACSKRNFKPSNYLLWFPEKLYSIIYHRTVLISYRAS